MTSDLEHELARAQRRIDDLAILQRRFHPRHQAAFDAGVIFHLWRAVARAEQRQAN
jgi:hypothetical protein